jgi:hypothetical protein
VCFPSTASLACQTGYPPRQHPPSRAGPALRRRHRPLGCAGAATPSRRGSAAQPPPAQAADSLGAAQSAMCGQVSDMRDGKQCVGGYMWAGGRVAQPASALAFPIAGRHPQRTSRQVSRSRRRRSEAAGGPVGRYALRIGRGRTKPRRLRSPAENAGRRRRARPRRPLAPGRRAGRWPTARRRSSRPRAPAGPGLRHRTKPLARERRRSSMSAGAEAGPEGFGGWFEVSPKIA